MTQSLITFHHGSNRRYCVVICWNNRQTFYVAVTGHLIEIAANCISHHDRLRRLVNALAQEDFTIRIFLQELGHGFRLQLKRAPYRVLLVCRIKDYKRGFPFV